jgi:hypothetical protein
MTVPSLNERTRWLARGSDLEHLVPALRALALGCRPAILHGDLNGVFNLTLRFALHAIRFCCHLGYLRLVPGPFPGLPAIPLEGGR